MRKLLTGSYRPLALVLISVVTLGSSLLFSNTYPFDPVPTAQAAPVTFTASLTGPGESPPNTSPGNGFTQVDLDLVAHTMRVQVSFGGLTGPTTASHIHACTAVPGTGATSIATTTPTFPNFPLGVTAGSYDRTLNTLDAGTWNPAYIAANGGTPATAETALATCIAAGGAYLNVHTVPLPGGEIRGFLSPTPPTATYTASLSGPAESPANTSPGTGTTRVDFNAATHRLRVQVTFTGLLGPTTASHIHACTAVPGAGTAGIATTVPTFPGFPLGVTSGTYDNTLNTLDLGSWNPAYVTANGGTAASAEAALITCINAGGAYLNVHSVPIPSGEIRGFLTAVPAPPTALPTNTIPPSAVGGRNFKLVGLANAINPNSRDVGFLWNPSTGGNTVTLNRVMSNAAGNANLSVTPSLIGGQAFFQDTLPTAGGNSACYQLVTTGTGGAVVGRSDFECIVVGIATGTVPANVKVELDQGAAMTVSWDPVPGASGYVVWGAGTDGIQSTTGTTAKLQTNGSFTCALVLPLNQAGAVSGASNLHCVFPGLSQFS